MGTDRPDDEALHKAQIIERCLIRVHEVHGGDDASIFNDLTRQDSIILNIHRACEAAIDLAMHLVRRFGLGVPRDSRDGFRLLEHAGHITPELSRSLQGMVGFRNVAVHQYDDLQLAIVAAVIAGPLSDLRRFAARAVELTRPE